MNYDTLSVGYNSNIVTFNLEYYRYLFPSNLQVMNTISTHSIDPDE